MKNPPKLATWFLLKFLRDDLAEDVSGDLAESFGEMLKTRSLFRARLGYWLEVMAYCRPFAIRKIKRTNPTIMYKSYLKSVVRGMSRRKLLSSINIVGLALGMAVSLTIILWIWDEVTYNRISNHFDRTGRVIQNVTNNGEVQTWWSVPWPLAEELRKNYGSDFEQVVLTTGANTHVVSTETLKLPKKGIIAERGFQEMFSLEILRGIGNVQDDPAAILISQSAAIAFFGEDDPIGRIMKLDEQFTVHVAGVYKDFPMNCDFESVDFIAAWKMMATAEWTASMSDPWRPNAFLLYVRLKDRATFVQASERIREAKYRNVNDALKKKKPALFIHPMSDWHLKADFKEGVNVGGRIRYVWLFSIIGAFVLLMACINFMNLTTARSEHRAKEVGIRKTVGSLQRQLLAQFFCESVLIAFIALFLAILGVRLVIPILNQLTEKRMSVPLDNPVFWLAATAFAFITGLLCGSYPAFYLSSIQPGRALKGLFRPGKMAGISRKSLVVLQFTVSVVLIAGTVTVFQQIEHGLNRKIGYDRSALISCPVMGEEIHKHFKTFKDEVEKTGYVVSVAESGSAPTSGQGSTSRLEWPGKDPDLSIDFQTFGASAAFGRTVGWDVIEGRDFIEGNIADSTSVIINESALHYMQLKDPIGQTLRLGNDELKVVGVVGDIVFNSPYERVQPCIYFVMSDRGDYLTIRLNGKKDARDAIASIEPIFKQYVPDLPFAYQFADIEYAKKFQNEGRIGKLAALFTALAILISSLGIFGLASFQAEQRTKEIGIRKVLGASVFELWGMLSGNFVVLVLISSTVAVPIAYAGLNAWLQNFNYRTDVSWWTLALASGGTLVITLLTVSYHALHAANMRPVRSLRTE